MKDCHVDGGLLFSWFEAILAIDQGPVRTHVPN